ncbi:MAG: molybdopterin-synthase adenylyltransferase MoeB [Rhizobiaceae bacterium]
MNEPQDPLSSQEIERYARHIILSELGGAGQQKLKRTKVLVIGAGGLGAPVLSYLAAAGIGTLGIVDDDRVSLSNLQRQVIFDTDLVGHPKVSAAAARVAKINPHTIVDAHEMRLTADNARNLIARYDIVVDGSDNFETRYLVADVCEHLKMPLVAGALGRFDGSLTVLKPYETNADGVQNPRYRDLFPERPPAGLVPSCAEAGIIGALAGVIGTLQAMEVIKLAAGIGEPLVGKILLYDGMLAKFDIIKYRRVEDGA